jgi:hypothetical protein
MLDKHGDASLTTHIRGCGCGLSLKLALNAWSRLFSVGPRYLWGVVNFENGIERPLCPRIRLPEFYPIRPSLRKPRNGGAAKVLVAQTWTRAPLHLADIHALTGLGLVN